MVNEKFRNDKLFFTVKYSAVAVLEALVFLAIILVFGSISFWQALALSLLNLTGTTFIITKLLEGGLDRLAFFVCEKVDESPKIRKIAMRYL